VIHAGDQETTRVFLEMHLQREFAIVEVVLLPGSAMLDPTVWTAEVSVLQPHAGKGIQRAGLLQEAFDAAPNADPSAITILSMPAAGNRASTTAVTLLTYTCSVAGAGNTTCGLPDERVSIPGADTGKCTGLGILRLTF